MGPGRMRGPMAGSCLSGPSLKDSMVLSLSVLWGPETAPHRAPRGTRWEQGLSVPCTHTGPSSPPQSHHRGPDTGRDGRKRPFPARGAAEQAFSIIRFVSSSRRQKKTKGTRGAGQEEPARLDRVSGDVL